MKNEPQALAMEGVRFFGDMSASISHEIKNVLAIINENAGLLDDMVRMVDKGKPLSPERLAGLARSLKRQVIRGDHIVTTLNRLAHSADHASEPVDVGELIGFIVQLTDRLIRMKTELPRIEIPATPLVVVTNRFFLEHLIWACLNRSLDAGPPKGAITIRTDSQPAAVRIQFRGLTVDSSVGDQSFPSVGEEMVAGLLGAQVTVDQQAGLINLMLPSPPNQSGPKAGPI